MTCCRKALRLIPAILLSVLMAPAAAPTGLGPFLRQGWASDSPWSDGAAEVALYRGESILDGASRPHNLHIITVAEDLNREYGVKADFPHGDKPIQPAIRQTMAASIETPSSPRRLLVTVLRDRADIARPIKMTVSTQDWGGATGKRFDLQARPPVMHYDSYWDGEGAGAAPLPSHGAAACFEEELPLLVRALALREGLEAAFLLEPSQSTNRAVAPVPVPSQLSVARPRSPVVTRARTFPAESTWEVLVEARDGRRMTFWVAEESPNTLAAFDLGDGRRYELVETARLPPSRIGG